MKKIDDYSQEELVALYKRLYVYSVTWWFKYYRLYKLKPERKEEPIIQSVIDRIQSSYKEAEKGRCAAREARWGNITKISLIEYKKEGVKKSKGTYSREYQKLEYEETALKIINQCLYWFGGEYDRHVELESEGYTNYFMDYIGDLRSVEDMECELHINDSSYIRDGQATDHQVYEFVWETLQYLNIEELGKLLKFVEVGIENNWNIISTSAGRKSRNCEVNQIDLETGKVVNTFKTRNELIEKLGIKKSHLSQCIKTSNDNPGNSKIWKKWIGEDGKKYGFVEVLK